MRKVIIWFLTLVLIQSVSALELSDVDFNNDNNIDINDIKELIPNFGKSSGFDAKFDVNSDGKIGIYDLVLVARRFGQTYEDSLLFCGNGVWDTGETLSNCPQDCTEYCNNPPDEITVLDTGEYIFGAYMMPGGYPGGTPPPPSSTYDQNRFEFIWNKIISNQPYLPGADQPIIPLLNPYDESNPIAIDWMIKWALEHGVSLFVYDWFWYDGQNWFDDMKSLEQGFMNSKYLDEYPMEFAVMWTNVYDSSYPEAIYDDRTRMMNYAIDNYFVHPNYLKIDGKPVFFIYRHDNIPASKYVRISSEKGEKISSQIIDREYVTDGIVDDLKYAAINSDQNNCIELNLGRVYNVSKIEIWHRKGRTYYASTVLVSADKNKLDNY